MNCGVLAIEFADALQPAQHIAEMAAEDAAIGVQLVQHDVAQIFEQARPASVWWGRIPVCSMSGLVRTMWLFSRMALRASLGVSPS